MNDLSIFNGVKYRREPANTQTTCADCQIAGCSGPDYSDDWEPPVDCGVNRPIPKGYPVHPNDACSLAERPEIRALTTAERAQIQTFPADFRWVGTKTDVEQMIGNAVPVKLAEFIAETLRNFLEKLAFYDYLLYSYR